MLNTPWWRFQNGTAVVSFRPEVFPMQAATLQSFPYRFHMEDNGAAIDMISHRHEYRLVVGIFLRPDGRLFTAAVEDE